MWFTNTSVGADAYEWHFGDGTMSSAIQPVHTYGSSGTYTVVLSISNGCGADSAVQAVTITAEALFMLSGPDSLCADEEALYAITLDGAGILSSQWSNGDADTDSVQFSASLNDEVSVEVIADNGCTYFDTIEVRIIPMPSADFTFSTEDCGTTVQFSDASLNAFDWQWDFGNGMYSSMPDPVAFYEIPGIYSATLIISGECGTDTASFAVTASFPGTVQLNGPAVICDGEEATFSIELSGADMVQVLWSTGDTTSVIQLPVNATQQLSVTVTGSDGCVYAAETHVQVIGPDGAAVHVPNVFSPNGDGLNENFGPQLPDPGSFIGFLVLDRWGEEVYATTSILRPWYGLLNGAPVPDGTYFYIVRWMDRCSGERKEEHGHVTLLR